MISFTDKDYLKSLPYATENFGEAFAEAQPKWWRMSKDYLWANIVPKNHLEILFGDGQISQISRSSTSHLYSVFARSTLVLIENTAYFPGWEVKIDGKIAKIEYQNLKYPGRMIFSVKSGLHTILVDYKDSIFLKIAKRISLFGFFAVLIFFEGLFVIRLFKNEK